MILERRIEYFDIDCIDDCLCIDDLESCINSGAYELQVGEFIIRYTQYLKAHMFATDGDGVDFGGFVCPYNIVTLTQKRMKGEETLSEVVKHKKYLESINMSEDKAITVYNFSIFDPGFLGGKRSTKSDTGPLPDYSKWSNKSLQIALGYNIDKTFDPLH